MARIGGVNVPDDKHVEISLTYVHGIGRSRSNDILAALKIDPQTKMRDVPEGDQNRIREFISENFKVEGELRSEVGQNIKRLMDSGCYRGQRHRKGLPVRGQRTRTNASTRKGPKKGSKAKKK